MNIQQIGVCGRVRVHRNKNKNTILNKTTIYRNQKEDKRAADREVSTLLNDIVIRRKTISASHTVQQYYFSF